MLFVDVSRLIRRHLGVMHHTGIDRVNLEYGRWVYGMGGRLCLRQGVELKQLSQEAWAGLLLGVEQPGNSREKRRHRVYLLLRSLLFRRPIPKGSTLLVSTHSWLAHEDTWLWLRKRNCKAVVFLHDLIPIQFPEYAHPREKALHERRLDHTLRYSRGIIVNSSCTGSAVRAYAKRVGLPVPPILVAPLGHELPALGSMPPPQDSVSPYFLVLGTIEPRKNHLLLLTLWRELVKRHGEAAPRLIIVGRRGWECEQVVDLLDRCEAIHPYLIEKNDASDKEVFALLAGARALLMPSYAEGFGMPVQEALAMGIPVISSPLPAIKEFAREIPDYAEPHNGTRWLKLIEDYAKPHSPEREAQLQRLPAFRHHTWQEHFKRVAEFLEAELGCRELRHQAPPGTARPARAAHFIPRPGEADAAECLLSHTIQGAASRHALSFSFEIQNPESKKSSPMALQTIYAVGFSPWKRQHVRAHFQDRNLVFVSKPSRLPKKSNLCIAKWGLRIPNENFPPDAEIICLEDGFLRSVGLGADLVRPLSWVSDGHGIYYDPRKPSDLELILQQSDFDDALLVRASKLAGAIVAAQLTKYNTGTETWQRPNGARRVILVPGQVESDASIRCGAKRIKTNLGLLEEVRRHHPDAFIGYKPHPDVVAGLRVTGAGEGSVFKFCDQVIGDVQMADLLSQVDEVHTLTSLTGFEALMRSKKVVTYGMPFYAGWGLTEDLGMSVEVAERRQRRLKLDELIAGTLILYPTYVSRETGVFITPEQALDELIAWRDNHPTRLSTKQRLLRFFLRRIAN
jgi:capsular polysaccharide export protein